MGTQSTAKTLFIFASMGGWLLVGAALMYLSPFLADWVIASDRTHAWIENLSRSGYNPTWGTIGGAIALSVTSLGNLVWYRYFDGKI